MDTISDIMNWLREAAALELFRLGESAFTLGTLMTLIVSTTLLFYVTAQIKRLLIYRILPRYNLDKSISMSIATLTRYALIVLGLIIIVQAAGIDLSTLSILIGALGIGIGLGLQNITNNFISGLIILFERPVNVGDRVEVGQVAGNIVKISARATTIVTNDNISIIVPNSDLINKEVINWSLNDYTIRCNFPVRVSYREDPQRIRQLLLEVAHETKGVLESPPSDVLLEAFDDSAFRFNLRVWTSEFTDRPGVLHSHLNYAIAKKFKAHNVEIPFPQRDLHLRTGFDPRPGA
jgi:small-conductance mechanosensitive channel